MKKLLNTTVEDFKNIDTLRHQNKEIEKLYKKHMSEIRELSNIEQISAFEKFN